jgi:ribosomal protein S27AE
LEWELSKGVLEGMKCIQCNSTSIAELIYGLCEITDALELAIKKKEIILCGCLITDHDSKWECNDCGKKWGVVDHD